MNYTAVKNPVWANAEHTIINCEVDFDDLSEEFVPFTADPNDTYNPSSKPIFDDCKNEVYGPVAPYVAPVPTAEQNKQTAIFKLQDTDWTATVDISNAQYSNPYLTNQDEFLAYRSQIRQYAVNPIAGNINWPTEPTAVWANV